MGKKKTVIETPVEAPWTLTQEDLDDTTKQEYLFGTTRCLPPEEIIPEEFWEGPFSSNVYVRMIDAMHIGDLIPEGDITFHSGFTGEHIFQFIEAHLRSVEPRYEHKIAGLAYMISKIMTVKEVPCSITNTNKTQNDSVS